MFLNFNFSSSAGKPGNSINPQFQDFPKPNPNPNPNPSFDHESVHDRLDETVVYLKDVSDYLMLEESLEERELLSQNKGNVAEIYDEYSSNSVLAADDRKYERVKKYSNEKQEVVRVAFRTKSKLEIMDDGFKWRKYGKKRVKCSPHPRNYYKCSEGGCSVKKRVEREGNDSSYVITTYQGLHNHQTPTSSTNCVLYSN